MAEPMRHDTEVSNGEREPLSFDLPLGNGRLAAADLLSPRVKHLLGQAMEEPESLDPGEVRELGASVVFWLAGLKEAGRPVGTSAPTSTRSGPSGRA